MKTVAIIQARMGSQRLPGKVLLDIEGQTLLGRVLERLRAAESVDQLMVATTKGPADDPIAELCASLNWPCFRGSSEDVLDRYYRAAMACHADIVVRVTADCPLLDPALIDAIVNNVRLSVERLCYSANVVFPLTFPNGLDVEAMSMESLGKAWSEDIDPASREHVTPYIRRQPKIFKQYGVFSDADCSGYRWTLDTPEDLEVIRQLYAQPGGPALHWKELLLQFEQHPEWNLTNCHIEQKYIEQLKKAAL